MNALDRSAASGGPHAATAGLEPRSHDPRADARDDLTIIQNPSPNVAARAPAQDYHGLQPGTRLGEFEIVGLIGEGGFGIVYLAHDTSLDRRVAIKEYMPAVLAERVGNTQIEVKSVRHEATFQAGLKSFINEARLLAQFDHDSLVKVYRFWEANGTAYMVMPYYEGMTLKDTLKSMPGPPAEAWLRALLAPLLEALVVLHDAHCYHRDISPDNVILLAGSERPVLLDFGAARRVIGDMTQALTVILKPGYAPIEQYAEVPAIKQGPASDLYALAAMIYFAIVGRAPTPAVGRMVKDTLEPLRKVAAGRYSERFLRALDRALAVLPEQRPQSAQQFADELGIDIGRTRRAAPVDAPGLIARRRKRDGLARPGADDEPRREWLAWFKWSTRRWSAAVALMLVVVLSGGAVWVARGAHDGYLSRVAAMIPASLNPFDHPRGGANSASVATRTPSAGAAPRAQTDARTDAQSASGATTQPLAHDAPLAATATNAHAQQASAPTPHATSVPPFSPADEFERIVGLADHSIEVAVKPPMQKAVIDHDLLHFTVTSSVSGYLYVFIVDPARQFLLLFPNEIDRDNRIGAHQHLSLPRASWKMFAGEPAGVNHFIAIVSKVPRDFRSLGLQRQSVFEALSDTAQQSAAARRTPLASPFAGEPVCPTDDAPGGARDQSICPAGYGAASFKIEAVASSR